MSEFGEVLATISPVPRGRVAWSSDGQRVTVVAEESCTLVDAATLQKLTALEVVGTGSFAYGPGGRRLAVAGKVGAVKEVGEFQEPIDCSELPRHLRAMCEEWNRHVGFHVTGHIFPPEKIGVQDTESEHWLWDSTEAEAAAVKELVYSPDGRLLAIVESERIRLVDPETGVEQHVAGPFSTPLVTPLFSRDSGRLATAEPGQVVLVDTASGETLWTSPVAESITGFAFTKDDAKLVACAGDEVIVFDAAGGAVQATVRLQEPRVDSPSVLSPDLRRIARAGDGTMALWDLADGSRRFETQTGDSPEIAFNPVNPEVAVGSGSGVKLLNLVTGALVWQDATVQVRALAFAPDGQRLAVRDTAGLLRIHNMNPGTVSQRVHAGPVTRISVTSGENPLAVTASEPSQTAATATVFTAITGDFMNEKVHPGLITAVEVSPDGRHFATGSLDGGVRLFDARSAQRLWEPFQHNGPVNALAFTPDGAGIITASGDKTARLLDSGTGAERWKHAHPQAVALVAVSPDGRWIATCADRFVRVLAPATGEEICRISHDGRIRSIAFRPDGSMLASGADDGAVTLTDPVTGKMLGQLAHTRPVTAVAFSHDGSVVASAGRDRRVQLFDHRTTDPPRNIIFATTPTMLAAHPTEANLAVVTDEPDTEVVIIDPADGTELGRLPHPGVINDIAYSADGDLIATACEDTVARIYQGRRGQ
jgi:FOG: WD40 repeat